MPKRRRVAHSHTCTRSALEPSCGPPWRSSSEVIIFSTSTLIVSAAKSGSRAEAVRGVEVSATESSTAHV